MSTLGARISAARKAKGMTQEELAEKLGVSSQAVSKWENDVSCPDIALLPRLAKTLGMTVDTLLTGKQDEVMLVPEEQRKHFDQLTLRVRMNSADGDRIRVNLPLPLVKVCLELGVDIMPEICGNGMEAIRKIDFHQIVDLAERGMIGKIVEMESADGDVMEVVVE